MSRFPSLEHVPSETRRLLRDRLVRHLPYSDVQSLGPTKSIDLPDESLLSLLQHLTVRCPSEISAASAAHARGRESGSTEPALSELIDAGWLTVVWGRVDVPSELTRTIRARHAAGMPSLTRLLDGYHERTYELTTPPHQNSELASVTTAIQRGEMLPHELGCRTPMWVAARLWDRTISDTPDRLAALRVWVDRWRELWFPAFVPRSVWNEEDADAFRKAALATLESTDNLPEWEVWRAQLERQCALLAGAANSRTDRWLPPLPATLLDRARWLEDPSVAHALGLSAQYADLSALVSVLLSDVQVDDNSPAPHPLAQRIFALAVDRPDLLHILLLQLRSRPTLLADLLLYPRTSALASWLIARWSAPSSAYDRDLADQDNANSKMTAFTDAVSVMGFFLDQGSLAPPEAASLLRSIHQIEANQPRQGQVLSVPLLSVLRDKFKTHNNAVHLRMFSALSEDIRLRGLDSLTFGAILDVLTFGDFDHDADLNSLVGIYIGSITCHHQLRSADRVTTAGAAALFKLAMRAPQELRDEFLRLFHGTAPPSDGFSAAELTREYRTAYSLRLHIRVLCRAVVGLGRSATDELVGALSDAVRVGALQHREKGRVSAFAPHYESGLLHSSTTAPIAADIGSALHAVCGSQRDRLLGAILETDEPLVLAQLVRMGPVATRPRIEARINGLTPDTAGSIFSLTEAQARVDGLLSSGLNEAANRFLAAEEALHTAGIVPGRDLLHLQSTLRLRLLQSDWSAIEQTTLPEQLGTNEKQNGIDTLAFYRALAALKNPQGDREAAEATLAALHRRHRHVASYALNLFAIRIVLLLGDSPFAQLQGLELERGRALLENATEAMQSVGHIDDDVRCGFLFNRALLLLAVGDTSRAQEVLTSISEHKPSERRAAYLAIAQSRLGRSHEAVAMLDRAIEEFGRGELLSSARTHVLTDESVHVWPSTIWADDAAPKIRNALVDFKRLHPSRQAFVLSPLSGSIDELMLELVRSAASSVTALVPMMTVIALDDCEDDVTSLLKELLVAAVRFLEWSVSDQSRGGFTGGPRAGERDLVLTRGSTTMAVVEAVVFGRKTAWDDVRAHFLKLFGYSTCFSFFLLIYAYRPDLAATLERLKQMARDDAPMGFGFSEVRDLQYVDAGPTGFIAYFDAELGRVSMSFLLLDMRQMAQRETASRARRIRGRRSKR